MVLSARIFALKSVAMASTLENTTAMMETLKMAMDALLNVMLRWDLNALEVVPLNLTNVLQFQILM